MKSRKRSERNYGVLNHEMKLLVNATPEQQRRAFKNATIERLLKPDADFEMWAHRNQLPPSGEGWRTWLMMAGRGFGKTRAGSEWIHRLADGKPGVQIALVGATIADARSIMVEGVSGLLKVAWQYRRRLRWEPSIGRLRWPNGSEARLFSGDHADGLRGPQHHFAWFLTFEVLGESDPGQVAVAAILADASDGAIEASASAAVAGYAAYGANVRAAVSPLIETFAIALFDDGTALRTSNDAVPAVLTLDALGNSADQERHSAIQREFSPIQSVPSTLRLGYYDEARDFQAGEARAQTGETDGVEARHECPAVIEAGEAKRLANDILARQWMERDRLTVRLPQRCLGLRPGDRVWLPLTPREWQVHRVTVDSFVVMAELRPSWSSAETAVASDPGRALVAADQPVEPIVVALFEVSEPSAATDGEPTTILAASSPAGRWKRRMVRVDAGGTPLAVALPDRKSVLGTALGPLGDGPPEMMDEVNSVDVELIDRNQWLESRDESALAEGANLALIGREMVQFGDADALGEGRFRLSRLLRGRAGTSAATTGHSEGELFVLLEPATLRKVEVPAWLRTTQCSVRESFNSIPPIVRHLSQAGG